MWVKGIHSYNFDSHTRIDKGIKNIVLSKKKDVNDVCMKQSRHQSTVLIKYVLISRTRHIKAPKIVGDMRHFP